METRINLVFQLDPRKNGGSYANTFGQFYELKHSYGWTEHIEYYQSPKTPAQNSHANIPHFMENNCNKFKLELIYG